MCIRDRTKFSDMKKLVTDYMKEKGWWDKVEAIFGDNTARGSRAFTLMKQEADLWTVLMARKGAGRLEWGAHRVYSMQRKNRADRKVGTIIGCARRALTTALGRDPVLGDEWCTRTGSAWVGGVPVGRLNVEKTQYVWDWEKLKAQGMEAQREQMEKDTKVPEGWGA